MQPSDITIISVCYNSGSVLKEMLQSVHPDSPIVLVDNASTDTTPVKKLAQDFGTTLILNEQNLGFGKACNQGAAVSTDQTVIISKSGRATIKKRNQSTVSCRR